MEGSLFIDDRSDVFYNQAAEIDVMDGSFFDTLVVNSSKQFDTFWDHIDDGPVLAGSSGDNLKGNKKEDFNKMLNEWQQHLSSMEVLDEKKIKNETSDYFLLPVSNSAVSIDELFPIECPTPVNEELMIKSEGHNSHLTMPSINESIFGDKNSSEGILKVECVSSEVQSILGNKVEEKKTALEVLGANTSFEQLQSSKGMNSSFSNKTAEKISLNHQNIKDALPKELVEKIKASKRKNFISLIPQVVPMKTARPATRMQDAAVVLSRNKLLKLISNNGESVQLDHDYCSGSGSESFAAPLINFYETDSADYSCSSSYSRLPDYYVALAPQKTGVTIKPVQEDWSEKSSRKDSGLESGDVSDNSEEVPPSTKSISMVSVLKVNNLPKNNLVSSKTSEVKNSVIFSTSNSNSDTSLSTFSSYEPVCKKKLNLEEYRCRREERERIRNKDKRRTSPVQSLKSDTSSNLVLNPDEKIEEKVSGQAKVEMLSVEIQANPVDIENLASSKRKETRKESSESSRSKREYRKRRSSSSSSSSSLAKRKYHSSRRIDKSAKRSNRSRRDSYSRTRSIWSRSCSPSSSSSLSSCSTCRSRSRSSSRSFSHSDSRRYSGGKGRNKSLWRTKHRFNKSYRNHKESKYHQTSSTTSGRVSRSVCREGSTQNPPIEWSEKERVRQVEERRVVYVGRIEEGTTKAHLRERFGVFGPIIDISVHFREYGDNYGFVTFAYKVDAYEAVEHGNDDPLLPRYDLSFGGRRAFCKQRYADLDGERNNVAYRSLPTSYSHHSDVSFDSLLRKAQAQIIKRSAV